MAAELDPYLPWRLSGTYLEACNCTAICPCRRIEGRTGGRSTYGVCLGSLSWQIEEGEAGGVDLAGMRAVLANRYDDDEPGSPWSFALYVDERGDERQREALESIFLGRLGGTPELQFPWVWKPSMLLGVRHVAIEVDHTPGRGWFRAGRQIVADLLSVEDGPLEFELSGSCGYEATFEYSSDSA